MDATLFATTDPMPFITAAYGIGAAALFGFAAWTVAERSKLRRLLATVRPAPRAPAAGSR